MYLEMLGIAGFISLFALIYFSLRYPKIFWEIVSFKILEDKYVDESEKILMIVLHYVLIIFSINLLVGLTRFIL